MEIFYFVDLFIQQLKETTWLEYTGVLFGVIQVLLARANNVWLYPFGIASVIITIYIFYSLGLYAETSLNIYYLIMSIYGWYLWIHKKDDQSLQITKANKSEWMISLCIVALGFALLYTVLINFTDSKVPIMDAWISATAWAGMWLLAKRKLENWLFLNVSNIFAIPLLAYTGVFLYSILYLFLFIIAIFGYLNWKKIIKNREEAYVG